MFFPPRVQQAADAVLKAMADISGPSFFGLHLRVEDDFITYARNILRDTQNPLLTEVRQGLPGCPQCTDLASQAS